MEKIINFRPLARGLINKNGKHIKENTILRSGEVANASEHDLKTLKGYGVRYIYDFRSAEEVKRLPLLSSPLFTTLHVDIIKEASPYTEKRLPDDGNGMMKWAYGTQFSTTGRYKPAIEAILAQETSAFLYHCTAGKDRTGIFSAILMMVMDFNMDAVKEEYLRINAPQMEALKAHVLRQMNLPENTTRLDFMFTVREEYIDAYIGSIMKTHGSADAYLEEVLGITKNIKQELQQKYLTT